MIVEKQLAKGGVTVYRLCNDARETGGRTAHAVADFNDFETAVLVMKYMRGDRMPEADQKYAKEAISRVKGE